MAVSHGENSFGKFSLLENTSVLVLLEGKATFHETLSSSDSTKGLFFHIEWNELAKCGVSFHKFGVKTESFTDFDWTERWQLCCDPGQLFGRFKKFTL